MMASPRIISSMESRQFSDHGITMDFTVISVAMKHQLVTRGGPEEVGSAGVEGSSKQSGGGEQSEDDEEEQLSQAFHSQSSISDGSSFINATQSSVGTGGGDQSAEDDNDDELEARTAEDGFSFVFEEKNPNSSFVSRPIFR